MANLDAISRVVKLPQWHVVANALAAYLGEGETLSEGDRRLVRKLLPRTIAPRAPCLAIGQHNGRKQDTATAQCT